MKYDIILVLGDEFYDHPLCGAAIIKRVLEDKGYSVGVIDRVTKEADVKFLGKPNLFFGVSSGSVDSMVRNYTPLKKPRVEDKHLDYDQLVKDRADIVLSNWIKKNFKDSIIVLGGVEATLRRFTHYDYWENRLRRPILLDSRADVLVYGCGEKQIIEIAARIKANKNLQGIGGTCIVSRELPENFVKLPSHKQVLESKEKFCDMHMLFSNNENLAEPVLNQYVLQYKLPAYTTKDLDYYYSLDYSRDVPKRLRGFQFSVVTHRGCYGGCNFCSIKLTQGDRIVSRSEKSILEEIKKLTKHPQFRSQVDDLTGPTVNMYGTDCDKCRKDCMSCPTLDRSHKKLLSLLRRARKIKGVKKVNIKSGIGYRLCTPELIKELVDFHNFSTLRIAPENVNKKVLKLMNKQGDFPKFLKEFKKIAPEDRLSYYFITAHPGSTKKDAKELAEAVSKLTHKDHVQVFTPTPMSISTCMYYTGMNPKTKKKIFVPYKYSEKKKQKRIIY